MDFLRMLRLSQGSICFIFLLYSSFQYIISVQPTICHHLIIGFLLCNDLHMILSNNSIISILPIHFIQSLVLISIFLNFLNDNYSSITSLLQQLSLAFIINYSYSQVLILIWTVLPRAVNSFFLYLNFILNFMMYYLQFNISIAFILFRIIILIFHIFLVNGNIMGMI